MKTTKALMPSLLVGVMLGAAGCVTVDFKSPVGDFTKSMTQANATIRGYFTGMNDFERQLYLESALYDPSIEVTSKTVAGKSTGLEPVFSASGIKARTDAVDLLSKYGQRLTELAGTDAPARFETAGQTLGTNLANLDKTFQTLAGAKDPTADKYVGPISAIIGVVGRLYLEHKRDAALAKAVNEAAPSVNAILDQLEKDLSTVIQPLETTGLLLTLADSAKYYNENRGTLSFDQRKQALDRIDSAAARYQAFISARPAGATAAIRDAHAALVKYANSPHTPKDLGELAAAIESFSARVAIVAAAIKQTEKT